VSIARFKLFAGKTDQWATLRDPEGTLKARVALALIACTTALYISPVSSMAASLVKSHMATLFTIAKSHDASENVVADLHQRRQLLIAYPSEPILSEAALEILSEKDTERQVLLQLDGACKSGGILDAGSQGEMVMRFLFLAALRRLICSKRKSNGIKVCNQYSGLSIFVLHHVLFC